MTGSTQTWVLQSQSMVYTKRCTMTIHINIRSSQYPFFCTYLIHTELSTYIFPVMDNNLQNNCMKNVSLIAYFTKPATNSKSFSSQRLYMCQLSICFVFCVSYNIFLFVMYFSDGINKWVRIM